MTESERIALSVRCPELGQELEKALKEISHWQLAFKNVTDAIMSEDFDLTEWRKTIRLAQMLTPEIVQEIYKWAKENECELTA